MVRPPASPRRERRNEPPSDAELRARYIALEAFDRRFLTRRAEVLAGVDEAGRGALAGPVVAAAVVLPTNSNLTGVTDSKLLDEGEREALFPRIIGKALSVGIAFGHPTLIDEKNILNATLIAMARAVRNLRVHPDVVLVDGRDKIHGPQKVFAVIGGDRRSLSVAAASIVAKVARDRVMRRLHKKYPLYNFLNNKGYGTKDHIDAIDKHGLLPEHRRTYRVKQLDGAPRLL